MYRLFVCFGLVLAGCFPPVDETCVSIAEKQCELCESCGAPLSACGLADGQDCTQTLAQRCENQASTVEDPKAEVEECLDGLEAWTCTEFLDRAAQDRPATPDTCDYFL